VTPQTTIQILRCFTLGRYVAAVEGGELKIRGPQPLAGSLPASIEARRDELVAFLNEYGGGTWPPAPESGLREAQEFLGCTLAVILDIVEPASTPAKRRAA
jgi:hypothetical protein